MAKRFRRWIDRLWPVGDRPASRAVLLTAVGVGIIALGAQITIPMYPVPMTLQTLAVVIVGALFGSRMGIAATLAYLIAGVAGLPVFADWTSAPGLAFLDLKSGGYILGFILCAGVVGRVVERTGYGNPGILFLALILGHGLVFMIGIPWLAIFIGLGPATIHGLLPFLPGALAKSIIGVAVIVLCDRMTSSERGHLKA